MNVDGSRWVLEVMRFYSWQDGVIVTACLHIDVAGDSRVALSEACKDGIIGITIDEDYATGGFAHELLHELEGIEGLAIEVDAHEWCGLRLLEALKYALDIGDLLLELLLAGMQVLKLLIGDLLMFESGEQNVVGLQEVLLKSGQTLQHGGIGT